jgi:predicted Zn-dependent peptidase
VVVAAAGSVDHDALVALIEETGPSAGPEPIPLPDGGAIGAATRRVRFLRKDTEQYHLCLGAPGIPRDDERRFALRILDTILGGGASSRLFQEVRERRGLAYAVYSFTSLFAGTGEIGMYLGTRAENLKESVDVLASELDRFLADPATVAELDRARENVKGRVVLALESTSAQMNRLGSSVLAEMPILSVDEVIERIDAVGLDDVSALAAELYRPERLSIAGIGTEEDRFLAALEPLGGGSPAAPTLTPTA